MAGQVRFNLVLTRETVAASSLHQLVTHVPSTFGEQNTNNNVLILNAFRRLGALDEWHLEDIGIGIGHCSAQEQEEIIVPTDLEAIVPATKNGKPRAEFQMRITVGFSGTELARRDVADIVDEVGISRTGLEWILELAECRRGQSLVAADRPLHARELVCQLRSVVA